ncbi:MAG: sugar phosphate isomerase/epimerase [Oscillospiraceae bacterium]|nr:sugar phosphate isomerase/epimerase [Oscillospiraceae bacterium]
MKIGIQMYSVRDITQTDMKGALEKLAAMGYTSAEFAGFFGIPAGDIAAWLKELGLSVSGTHSRLSDLFDDWDATLEYHKAIGNRFYIIPSHDLSDQAKIDTFIAQVSEIAPKLKAQGITLAYHNHDWEFKPNADGSVVYDQLVERSEIALELDTFWAYAAGKCPVELMEKLRDRLVFIHIKDGFTDRKGMPLGKGTAPVKEVYAKAAELGIPMVVESETLTPDGLTESQICIDFLKSL